MCTVPGDGRVRLLPSRGHELLVERDAFLQQGQPDSRAVGTLPGTVPGEDHGPFPFFMFRGALFQRAPLVEGKPAGRGVRSTTSESQCGRSDLACHEKDTIVSLATLVKCWRRGGEVHEGKRHRKGPTYRRALPTTECPPDPSSAPPSPVAMMMGAIASPCSTKDEEGVRLLAFVQGGEKEEDAGMPQQWLQWLQWLQCRSQHHCLRHAAIQHLRAEDPRLSCRV